MKYHDSELITLLQGFILILSVIYGFFHIYSLFNTSILITVYTLPKECVPVETQLRNKPDQGSLAGRPRGILGETAVGIAGYGWIWLVGPFAAAQGSRPLRGSSDPRESGA
jgi:hypothetical protein